MSSISNERRRRIFLATAAAGIAITATAIVTIRRWRKLKAAQKLEKDETREQTLELSEEPEVVEAVLDEKLVSPWMVSLHRKLEIPISDVQSIQDESVNLPCPQAFTPQLVLGQAQAVGFKDVLVQGESEASVLAHVHSIQESVSGAAPVKVFRQFADEKEFGKFVHRVEHGKAKPVLRKLFLYSQSKCNLEQEVWFEDKDNPLAKKDSLKNYVVLHVHHHRNVKSLEGALSCIAGAAVDAVNARHLSKSGSSYQTDNPFFQTYIEPSSKNTLKVFPPANLNWTCGLCNTNSFYSRQKCRNVKKKCPGQRPCFAWNILGKPDLHRGLALVLEAVETVAGFWRSGGKKDRRRAAFDDDINEAACGVTMLLDDLYKRVHTTRVCAMCIGINEYSQCVSLLNCENDAKLLSSKLRACANAEVVSVVGKITSTDLNYKVDDFVCVLNAIKPPPQVMVFFFAGHGLRYREKDYLLASDFRLSTISPFERGAGCLDLQRLLQIVASQAAEHTSKVFFVDCCRNVPESEQYECTNLSAESNDGQISLPKNTMLVFASEAGGKSLDGSDGNSPFTRCLVENIFTPGVPLLILVAKSLQLMEAQRASTWGLVDGEVVLAIEEDDSFQATLDPFARSLLRPIDTMLSTRPKFGRRSSRADAHVKQHILKQAMDAAHLKFSKQLLEQCPQPDDPELREYMMQERQFTPLVPDDSEACVQKAKQLAELSKTLQDYSSESEISEADTMEFYTGDQDADSKVVVHVEGDVSTCSASMRMLEAYVAKYVDSNILDIWAQDAQSRDTEENLAREIKLLVSLKLLRKGCVADDCIKEILQDAILGSNPTEETRNIVGYAVQKMADEIKFMSKINDLAAQGYFCVDNVVESYSYMAILNTTRLGAQILHAMLSRSLECKQALWTLGFRVFLFDNDKVRVVLRDLRSEAAVPEPLLLPIPKSPASNTTSASPSLLSGTPTRPYSFGLDFTDQPEPCVLGYVIEFRLGEGSEGSVWKAHCCEDTSKTVAIKVCGSKSGRSLREFQNLKLVEHPNIVRVMDFVPDQKHFAIVMEHIKGVSLLYLMQMYDLAKDMPRILGITRQLLEGLGALHRVPISHRDVKPSNIMIESINGDDSCDGRVVLVDLGLSKFSAECEQSVAGSQITGTPAYWSPEAARGEERDHQVDVWAAGVVVYEMLAGQRPFQAPNDNALLESIKNDVVTTEMLPFDSDAPLYWFIAKALAKCKSDRFCNAIDMLEAFDRVQNSSRALEEAVLKGLVKKSVNEACDGGGNTPLMCAVKNGEYDHVLLLLAAFSDVKVANKKGETCGHLAAQYGDVKIMDVLVKHGIEKALTTFAGTGESCLHYAVRHAQLPIVSMLSQIGGKEFLGAKMTGGLTCLDVAVQSRNIHAVEELAELFKRECLLLGRTENGQSCLHLAVLTKDVCIVSILLEAGGRDLLFAKNGLGETCVHVAVQKNCVEVLAVLIEAGGKELLLENTKEGLSCLHVAVPKQNMVVISMLVEAGGMDLLRLTSTCGETCVHLATKANDLRSLELFAAIGGAELLLLRTNGSSNLDKSFSSMTGTRLKMFSSGICRRLFIPLRMCSLHRGVTCLDVAVHCVLLEVVQFLAGSGGKCLVFAKTDNHMTCIHHAAWLGHVEMMEALMDLGGEELIDSASFYGITCLHLAAFLGHNDLVCQLLDGVSTDQRLLFDQSKQGETCLHFASVGGHAVIVDVLVKMGGRELMMLCTTSGETCLHYAIHQGHLDVVQLLLSLCVDAQELLMAKTTIGETALHIAARTVHRAVLEHIIQVGGAALALQKTGEDGTVLHAACESSLSTNLSLCVNTLRETVGEDLTHRLAKEVDIHGRTFLHVYASNGLDVDLPDLLDMEALVRVKDNNGRTCVQHANEGGYEELVYSLLDMGGLDEDDQEEPCDWTGRVAVRKWKGRLSNSFFNTESRVLEFRGFCTVKAMQPCCSGSKGYYEIEVLRLDIAAQFGFATESFKEATYDVGEGVGDDSESWAVDGFRVQRWHCAVPEVWGSIWRQGDIVGFACDLEDSKIHVSVNGDYSHPNGVLFDLSKDVTGLFPAFTGDQGKFRYNLGSTPFVHSPPTDEYRSFEELRGVYR